MYIKQNWFFISYLVGYGGITFFSLSSPSKAITHLIRNQKNIVDHNIQVHKAIFHKHQYHKHPHLPLLIFVEDRNLCAKLCGLMTREVGGCGDMRAERDETTDPRGPFMPANDDTVACSSLMLMLYSAPLYSPSCSSRTFILDAVIHKGSNKKYYDKSKVQMLH